MSYFLIRIKYSDTGETVVVNHPNDLRNGKGFYVLETKVRKSN